VAGDNRLSDLSLLAFELKRDRDDGDVDDEREPAWDQIPSLVRDDVAEFISQAHDSLTSDPGGSSFKARHFSSPNLLTI
jgi:hypothetical protein